MNTPMIINLARTCIAETGTAIASLMLLTLTALAGLPQPMCVYYGQALDGHGWPYTTNAQVVLLHGSHEIASHTVNGSLSPGVNFALYVHLDDGRATDSYSPRALHSGDLVSIVVRDPGGEKTIMEDQAVPAVGAPGELIAINVTAATDADGDGLPDAWEEEMVFWSFGALGSIWDVNPWDDFDGDGQSNWDEYQAGTFAFLDYDRFFAEQYGRTSNGRFSITFLTVPGKLYGARYVTALNHSLWVASPLAASDTADFQTTPVEGDGGWLTLYLPGDLSSRFYRPTVESFGSYRSTATRTVSSLMAYDHAGNHPYPGTQFNPGTRFTVGDNGGVNFEPWLRLEGNAAGGSSHLAGSIGDSSQSWSLNGTYAVGRSLPGVAHHGLWHIRMVHDPNNTDFSGFNLKSASLPGFAETEIIRVGMTASPIASTGKGISVSTDGGQTYTFLDCAWQDGRGDSIIYQIWWDESGEYTLTVENVHEGIISRWTGDLPSSAVTMLGVGVFGDSPAESVQFDSLIFQTDPGLTLSNAGDKMVLSWPAGFTSFSLQSSSDFSQPNSWTTTGEPISQANGLNSVTVPITAGRQFFRLSR